MRKELFLKTMSEFTIDLKRMFLLSLEERIDLTYAQWRVMKEIKYADSTITASDIVERIGSDKVTVSGIISRLVQKGYVVKTKDPEDNRRGLLSISEKAHTMCKDVMDMETDFRNRLFEELDEQEIHNYLNTTEKLLFKLKEIDGGNR